MSQRTVNTLRILGSLALCSAYVLVTSGFVWQGVIINTAGQFLLMPFGIKAKAWDLIGLSGFFLSYNFKFLLGL
jgi:hypothetical protein